MIHSSTSQGKPRRSPTPSKWWDLDSATWLLVTGHSLYQFGDDVLGSGNTVCDNYFDTHLSIRGYNDVIMVYDFRSTSR